MHGGLKILWSQDLVGSSPTPSTAKELNGFFAVLGVGLEPTRSCDQRILSPPCMPFHHPSRICQLTHLTFSLSLNWRRQWELHPRMSILQIDVLLLHHAAKFYTNFFKAKYFKNIINFLFNNNSFDVPLYIKFKTFILSAVARRSWKALL